MKVHEEWLNRALNDIESAKILLASPKRLTDTAIYHTHQCAEKSLKSFLVYKNIQMMKIHDLKMLLNMCSKVDESFNQLIEEANFLNPFAVFFRYPGFNELPEPQTVTQAIQYAESIYRFVKDKINERTA